MTKTAKHKFMWETVKFLHESKNSLQELERRLRSSFGFKVAFISGFVLLGYLPYEIRKVVSEKQPSIISLTNKTLARSEERKQTLKNMFD